MIILIDAYNFIKQIEHQSFIDLVRIDGWIARFNLYMKQSSNTVILVFDAGPSFYASREYRDKVLLMYSGQQQSADDVIQDVIVDMADRDILVVTSDREIRDFADSYQIVSIGSQEFYKIFQEKEVVYKQQEKRMVGTLHKMVTHESEELDMLMEYGSRILMHGVLKTEKKPSDRLRNNQKLSKKDRKMMKKIEKI